MKKEKSMLSIVILAVVALLVFLRSKGIADDGLIVSAILILLAIDSWKKYRGVSILMLVLAIPLLILSFFV